MFEVGATVSDKNCWDASTVNVVFFLLACALSPKMLFIAVNSPNLGTNIERAIEKTIKCPNNFN